MGRIIVISHSEQLAFPVRVVTGSTCILVRFCIPLEVSTFNISRPLYPDPRPPSTIRVSHITIPSILRGQCISYTVILAIFKPIRSSETSSLCSCLVSFHRFYQFSRSGLLNTSNLLQQNSISHKLHGVQSLLQNL
jgi:hypothetical protein